MAETGLRINTAGRFHCASDWSWDTSLRPCWRDTDLWAVLAGTGRLETPEGGFVLGRGDVFLLRGGRRYVGTHDPRRPLLVHAVHFDFTGLADAPDGAPPAPLHRRILPLEFFAEILERVLDAHFAGRSGEAALWLAAALQEIATVDAGRRSAPPGQPRMAAVERLCREIRAHPERRAALAELAAEAGCSEQHLIRLFRRHTRLSPRQYQVRARVEAARSLLSSSDHPLKRIAQILGYRDEYYFSRQFRSVTGSSPGAYRRSVAGSAASP